MHNQAVAHDVRYFETCAGASIFQIPMYVFPELWGHAYLVLLDDASGSYRLLIDTGSGLGDSNQHLEAGLRAASDQLGRSIGLGDLTHILVTHGHIDHIGGLAYVRPRTGALLGVHELDLCNLANYEERINVVARNLSEFLLEAGLSQQQSQKLVEMYRLLKSFFHSLPVDFTYEAVGMQLGPFELLHVPGHCAGHVVIRLHDVLFSGDHVLDEISPHMAPERLTLSTGLGHYLQSLQSLRSWASGIRLTLGGHNQPIADLPARIDAIQQVHTQRLGQILQLLAKPHTIQEISQVLFGEVHSYNVLLALEEAGAHVEYLYQRGLLKIDNLDDFNNGAGPLPIRYRSVSC
ncbi:MAG: MBL fold metallo-hydrolase [Anaerolineales bacterium]|nr:MBL fold metallo-hydrolase [Anaerolineales bacterium]